MFERFYRVDKSRSNDISGTGLGLSVTRQVVLMHRGEIDVQSTVDVGTIFTVKIPLTYVPPQGSDPKADAVIAQRKLFRRRI